MIRQLNFKPLAVRLATSYRSPIYSVLSSPKSAQSAFQRSSLSTSQCFNVGTAGRHLAKGVAAQTAQSPVPILAEVSAVCLL